MALICISNRLGVKQKNVFIIFESLHFDKILGLKIDKNISYQLAIMTLIRISNHLGVKQKNMFLSFLKALILSKFWRFSVLRLNGWRYEIKP